MISFLHVPTVVGRGGIFFPARDLNPGQGKKDG